MKTIIKSIYGFFEVIQCTIEIVWESGMIQAIFEGIVAIMKEMIFWCGGIQEMRQS